MPFLYKTPGHTTDYWQMRVLSEEKYINSLTTASRPFFSQLLVASYYSAMFLDHVFSFVKIIIPSAWHASLCPSNKHNRFRQPHPEYSANDWIHFVHIRLSFIGLPALLFSLFSCHFKNYLA